MLLTMLRDLLRDVGREVRDLDADALAWRPHPNANSIGVTVWHLARWFDVLAHQVFRGQGAAEELWHQGGWRDRTGYDPRGVGSRGWGTVTGYTTEEVARIPTLTGTDLLHYYERSAQALIAAVTELGPEGMNAAPRGAPGEGTALVWLTTIVEGEFGHLGEIRALKSLRAHVLAG